ncbi:hypothetical protein GCM10010532_079260 [Dactylosporangium siamense]|uniref:Uncharacterized protein n=1 Tax=Dactylosporangium siamense TaxID=685454 RepID=A0A919PUT5_9ACTN|nr:hypothetical protein Dsi01nite_069790 [Dactylosporangium siamense]
MLAAVGAYANCGGPAVPSPFPAYAYDIDNDGAIDRFVAMRCPGSKADQLEVLTGKNPQGHPQRLGGDDAGPLIHHRDEVDLEHGCLMFADRTVLVGVAGGGNPSAVAVSRIGHWDSGTHRVVMREAPHGLTIPCGAIVPAART